MDPGHSMKKKRGGNRNPAADLTDGDDFLVDHNPAADLTDDLLVDHKHNPAADLTDDTLVEILSRLPVKSVCRFKCASRHWRDGLIANPLYRTKLPQTLTGFFYSILDSDEETSVPDFVSIAGRMDAHQVVVSPSLSFLPRASYRSIVPKHCSNGLLLCLCWKVSPEDQADYVVCNPATEKWVVVPGYYDDVSDMQLHLVVDRASSSGHFHLFALFQILENVNDDGFVNAVDIYSSETGAWSHKENGWKRKHRLHQLPHSVFLRGILYLITRTSDIIYMDTEGTTWGTISLQEDAYDIVEDDTYNASFIGESQGRLHYLSNMRSRDDSYHECRSLSVCMLDDNNKWIVKYRISQDLLFGHRRKYDEYCLVAIHPECNTIFFTTSFFREERDKLLLFSYHMGREEVRLLGTFDYWSCQDNSFIPYIPSFRVVGS